MGLTVFVLVAAVVVLLLGPARRRGRRRRAAHCRHAPDRLDALDFRFTLTETYTFWSGMLGGLFLMLSYFGCDQSQVQRYLTARSVDEGRSSLMMSAYWKIPLQVLVLMVGVLTFVFYSVQPAADALQPGARARPCARAAAPASTRPWKQEFKATFEARRQAPRPNWRRASRTSDADGRAAGRDAFRQQDAAVDPHPRAQPPIVVRQATGDAAYNDVNYVFPTFIMTALPDRARRALDRRDHHRRHRHHRRRAELARDRHRHRLLQAPLQAGRAGRALPPRRESRDRVLGRLRRRRRRVCEHPRLAHRGRQPVRVVLLWLDPRRLHAGHPDAARHGHRRVRGPHRRHVRRSRRSPSGVPTSRFSGTTSSGRWSCLWWVWPSALGSEAQPQRRVRRHDADT